MGLTPEQLGLKFRHIRLSLPFGKTIARKDERPNDALSTLEMKMKFEHWYSHLWSDRAQHFTMFIGNLDNVNFSTVVWFFGSILLRAMTTSRPQKNVAQFWSGQKWHKSLCFFYQKSLIHPAVNNIVFWIAYDESPPGFDSDYRL